MLLGKFHSCQWPNIEKIIQPSGRTAENRWVLNRMYIARVQKVNYMRIVYTLMTSQSGSVSKIDGGYVQVS